MCREVGLDRIVIVWSAELDGVWMDSASPFWVMPTTGLSMEDVTQNSYMMRRSSGGGGGGAWVFCEGLG